MGYGCRKCFDCNRVKSTNDFINQANIIHNKKYKYIYTIYTGIDKKVCITCSIHGDFYQTPHIHLMGSGCQKCAKIVSASEIKWLDYINIDNKYRQKTIKVKDTLFKVDAFNSITNTIYEFYGDFWHGNIKIYDRFQMNNLLNKTFGELYDKTIEREEFLRKNGFNVISMWESDFKVIK